MSQDVRLYQSSDIWDQPMQAGQRNLLRVLQDFWPKDVNTALDLGCGDGKLSIALSASTGSEITGIDSSQEALSYLTLPKVMGSAKALPFDDSSFDMVFSTDALEHMPDDDEAAAWAELFRVASKWVMVAVPFREELLDATACCHDCHATYHVNWHQRSYDISDLHSKAMPGWEVACSVVSGESWSTMLPLETHFRRMMLSEWSGWSLAICPHCGAPGEAAVMPEVLQDLPARALGQLIYTRLRERRQWRSHSEVLVIFRRDQSLLPSTPVKALSENTSASSVDLTKRIAMQSLSSYPQVAQYVVTQNDQLRIQFPVYEPQPVLWLKRRSNSDTPIHLSLEDAEGILFDGCALASGESEAFLPISRSVTPGYYGILATCDESAPLAAIRLGEGPEVLWARPPEDAEAAYFLSHHNGVPLYIQVVQETWLERALLEKPQEDEAPFSRDFFEYMTQQALRIGIQTKEQLQVEHDDVLRARYEEADRLAVKVQNLEAERDGLLQRAEEADRMAVDLQNLQAERDGLLQRAEEADRMAVDLQNLQAELEHLNQRIENRLGAAARKHLARLR